MALSPDCIPTEKESRLKHELCLSTDMLLGAAYAHPESQLNGAKPVPVGGWGRVQFPKG